MPLSVQAQGSTTNSLALGERLFNNKCAVCHGSEGDGGVGVPINLNDFLSTSSDRYLYQTIKLGRPGRVMPAFSSFSEKQIQSIIHYIRSWKPEIEAPVYSQERIKGDINKGQFIYKEKCYKCHREKGIGGMGTGVTFSRPRNADLIASAIGIPSFLASASDKMLKMVITNGRHSTPMPSAEAKGLNEDDVNNVVSYLRSLEKNELDEEKKPKEIKPAIIAYESSYSIKPRKIS